MYNRSQDLMYLLATMASSTLFEDQLNPLAECSVIYLRRTALGPEKALLVHSQNLVLFGHQSGSSRNTSCQTTLRVSWNSPLCEISRPVLIRSSVMLATIRYSVFFDN